MKEKTVDICLGAVIEYQGRFEWAVANLLLKAKSIPPMIASLEKYEVKCA